MSNIPIIGKIYKKIKKNKVLTAIIAIAAVAAVVYFTAGTGMAAFSPEVIGAGAATTTSVGATVATTTAAATASGAGAVAGTGASLMAAGTAGATASGVTAAEMLAAQTGVFGAEGAALTAAAMAPAVAAPVAASGGGILGFMAKNPALTMVGANAVSGAASGYSADKTREYAADQRRQEQERYIQEQRNRGLMGYDYSGTYAGPTPADGQQATGILSSEVSPSGENNPQNLNATAAPIIASQMVSAPTVQGVTNQQPGAQPVVAQKSVSLNRKDLPKLRKILKQPG